MRIILPIRFIIPLLSGRGRGRRGGGRAVNAGKGIVRAGAGFPQKTEGPAGRAGGDHGGITSPGANAACRNLGAAAVGQRILFRPRSDGNDHRGVNGGCRGDCLGNHNAVLAPVAVASSWDIHHHVPAGKSDGLADNKPGAKRANRLPISASTTSTRNPGG